jgi:TetR/AcrR family transcriptional regulator
VAQVLDRFETQLRQVLREAEVREALRPVLPLPEAANLLLSAAEGRIGQFVRSEFRRSPTSGWPEQFDFLMRDFFRPVPHAGARETGAAGRP